MLATPVTSPPPRQYYSHRHGLHQDSLRLTLDQLKELFLVDFKRFNQGEYFQQAFGFGCVDGGETLGTVGDAEAFFLRRLHRPGLWPVPQAISDCSEHDLFDVIELLYNLISKPKEGYYHNYNECGWHYSSFDQGTGRAEYRATLNEVLADYGPGYELSINGEIRELGESGQRGLIAEQLPSLDPERVDSKIEAAKSSFLRYGASLEDRRHAVRLLADAFEFLRPQLLGVITRKDESDLFNLANNFGIRHNDDAQKTDFDHDLWLDWMFYYYLNTTRLVLKKLAPPPPVPKKEEEVGQWWEETSTADLEDLPF